VKVLIVGGGPAGTLAAINLGNKCEVTLVEEHQAAGFPVQCAGLISQPCYDKLKKYSKRSLINRIEGAFFFSPDGNYIEMVGKRKGVVIERKILDFELIKEASRTAEIFLKSTYVESCVESGSKKARIVTSSGERLEEYDLLIGADGVNSRVAREFGFSRPEIFSAVQVELAFECLDENMVELYFGRYYSDGFFAYAIPIDSSTARLGVVSKSDPKSYLERLVEKHPSVSKRAGKSVIEVNAGAIPVGLNEIFKENVCLIGDSAGMVKPYTGGGIYYHLLAAEILGRNFPDLGKYRSDYLKLLGKDYRTGMRILRLYSKLSDTDYNELVRVGKDMFESYTKELDMDHPSSLLSILPRLIKLVSLKPALIAKIAKELAL
jgi:geranylgeranyl reductase family protein